MCDAPVEGPDEHLRISLEIEKLLHDLHSLHKEVRAQASRRLGETGEPALLGLLQAVLDPNWVVRYRALEALIEIPDPRVDPILIAALQDNRDHVRYMAAKGLGVRKEHKALYPLLRCLGDNNEFVRRSVVRALTALKDPRAIPGLRKRMREELVDRVTDEIKEAVARLEHP